MSTNQVLQAPALDSVRRSLPSQRATLATPPSVAAYAAAPQSYGADAVPTRPETTVLAAEVEAARQRGLQQGLDDAQARIEQEVQARWQRLNAQCEQTERQRRETHEQRMAVLDNLLASLERAIPDRLLSLEQQAIGLAYEALCKVCGPQIEQAPFGDRAGLMADLIRQGVAQLRGHALLVVRLHPQDHAVFVASESGSAFAVRHPHVDLRADAAVEPLGVLLDTGHGHLDAGLTRQLDRLRALWAGAGTAVGLGEASAINAPRGETS